MRNIALISGSTQVPLGAGILDTFRMPFKLGNGAPAWPAPIRTFRQPHPEVPMTDLTFVLGLIFAAILSALILFSIGYISFNLFFNHAAEPIRAHIDAENLALLSRFEAEVMDRFEETESQIRGPVYGVRRPHATGLERMSPIRGPAPAVSGPPA